MRLLIFCFLIFLTQSFTFCQVIEYEVKGNLPLIKQPKALDCWITVTTIMTSWRENKTYSIDEMISNIGDPWKLYYEANTGLSFEDQEEFISQMGMVGEPPANYMLEAYLDFLKAYGPLWITTGDGFSAHARILIGIFGDGTYENSEFLFINPATGKKEKQNALNFVREFEEEAYIANEENWDRLRIQIYHF